MGHEVTLTGKPKIKAFAIGEKPIWKIELIKNGKVIHSKVNSFENSNIITFLWKNRVEKDDLNNFDKSFWSRRLRGVQWQGRLLSTMGGLKKWASRSRQTHRAGSLRSFLPDSSIA